MVFWMHALVALEAPADATEIRLLNEDGQQFMLHPREDQPVHTTGSKPFTEESPP